METSLFKPELMVGKGAEAIILLILCFMPQKSCLAAVHWPHGSFLPLSFILHHCISNFIDIFMSLFFLVTKTNLAVHEDKNRVPYVKVGKSETSFVEP